ncbi:MAG: glycoside hydrolase family 172 protein [Armatimonadota bacterium]
MLLSQIYQMPEDQVETRWFTFENTKGEKGRGGKSNFGRKGSPCTMIQPGETLVLADIKGSGTIRRMWSTLWQRDPEAIRSLKIEMFWDGAKTPAVQVPFGDFFFHSMGNMATFENACFSSPEGRSFNCFTPMPFKKGAKIQVTNESDKANGIYYEVNATLGDKHNDNMLYFHSYWRRENMTTLRQDMTILPSIEGRGRFLGCNIGVRLHPFMTNFWWGEGEVKAYLDGDKDNPTLCGTGTEDYIGSGYGQGLFSNMYQGNQLVINSKTEPKIPVAYGFYRLHVPDPIYFHKDARVTIQVMGGPSYQQMLDSMDKDPSLRFMKAGDGSQYYTREELEKDPNHAWVMERIDDYCATAYWYMDKPENKLPPIMAQQDRIKDLP